MFWTTVLFVFDLLSRLDKHGSSYIENDLKGKENWFELAGGSSYHRGFELSGVDCITFNFWKVQCQDFAVKTA